MRQRREFFLLEPVGTGEGGFQLGEGGRRADRGGPWSLGPWWASKGGLGGLFVVVVRGAWGGAFARGLLFGARFTAEVGADEDEEGD